MSEPQPNPLESLHFAFSRLDRAFAQGRLDELAGIFAEEARLLWPSVEDIVGRAAIRSAYEEFFAQVTTLSFTLNRQVVKICGRNAFTIGRFIEDLQPNAGGPAERVHGRLVEQWSQREDGMWEVALLLTSRYAENDILSEGGVSGQ